MIFWAAFIWNKNWLLRTQWYNLSLNRLHFFISYINDLSIIRRLNVLFYNFDLRFIGVNFINFTATILIVLIFFFMIVFINIWHNWINIIINRRIHRGWIGTVSGWNYIRKAFYRLPFLFNFAELGNFTKFLLHNSINYLIHILLL